MFLCETRRLLVVSIQYWSEFQIFVFNNKQKRNENYWVINFMNQKESLDESLQSETLRMCTDLYKVLHCKLAFVPKITILTAQLVSSSPPTKQSCQFGFHIKMMLGVRNKIYYCFIVLTWAYPWLGYVVSIPFKWLCVRALSKQCRCTELDAVLLWTLKIHVKVSKCNLNTRAFWC